MSENEGREQTLQLFATCLIDQNGTVYGRPRNSFLDAKNAGTLVLQRADSMPKGCRKGF